MVEASGTAVCPKRKATMFCARPFIVLAVLAVLTLPATGHAHDYKLGDLTIQHPWARASIGAAKAGAAYLEIVNEGKRPDLLIAAASPVAEHAKLHTHLVEGGVAKMRPVEAVEITPGEPAILQPGGLHIMLMGLKAPLVEGNMFPVTLTFERAGNITIQVIVQAPDLDDHGDDGGHEMDKPEGDS